MYCKPSKRLRQLSIDLGWSSSQCGDLLRVISIHLNYSQNRVGLEGPLKHGQDWQAWFDGFLDGPMLDEAWNGGKQNYWKEIKDEDVDNAKLFLKIAIREEASSIRNYLKRGSLPKWMNSPANSDPSISSTGGFIDEQDSCADDNSATGREDLGNTPLSIATNTNGRNFQQNTIWELSSPPANETPISFGQRTPAPYHFAFRASEDGPTARRFASQSMEEIASRKRPRMDSSSYSNSDQAIAIIGTRGRQKSSIAVSASPLQFPVRRQPITFMTRLQIPNTDVARYESIDMEGVMALPAFLGILRNVHGMLDDQRIACLDVKIDGRTVNVNVGDEEGEWEWGMVLGMAHFSGVPDDELAFVDILTEYRFTKKFSAKT